SNSDWSSDVCSSDLEGGPDRSGHTGNASRRRPRFSISQMDVPTRQSYIMAVVGPEERSAAGGVTGVARTIGAALAPVFAGFLYEIGRASWWERVTI